MTVIVCLDEEKGQTFCGRRQSRDANVTADILRTVGDSTLHIAPFSRKLFPESDQIVISDDPLQNAGDHDYCFIEDRGIGDKIVKIKEIIVYNWNRLYPSDRKFDVSPPDAGFTLKDTAEFAGTSHEKITKEIYQK